MWDTFRKYITSNITGKVLCIQTSSAKISTKGPTNHIWKLLLTIQCLLWSMWLKKPASSPVRRLSSKSRSRQSTPRRNYDQKLANRPNCSKTAQYNLLYTCQPLQANNSTYWQWGRRILLSKVFWSFLFLTNVELDQPRSFFLFSLRNETRPRSPWHVGPLWNLTFGP